MDTARPTKPLISVIVPHLDQLDSLEACLESLEAQTLERSFFEIIVVDNGSVSGPEEQILRHPGVRLLYESVPGPGPARNCGVTAAVGEILCFIDADCRAHSKWLSVALATLSSSPPGIILGGDVQIWRDNREKYTGIEAFESVFGYRQKLHIERHGFSGSGNLAVRRADFLRVGPFAGILLAEDKDWGNRARDAGFVFKYVRDMVVFHPARPTLRQLCVQWDRLLQHTLNMARRHPHWRILWIARAIAVLFSPFVHVFEIMRSDQIEGLSARCKAIAILVIIRIYRAWKMFTLLLSSSQGVVWNRDAAVGAVESERRSNN